MASGNWIYQGLKGMKMKRKHSEIECKLIEIDEYLMREFRKLIDEYKRNLSR